MMKNYFYVTLKALLNLNYFFVMSKNGLIRKIRLIYDVKIWLTNNYNTNIDHSTSEDIQAMKFVQ